jgi:hypothetical protein
MTGVFAAFALTPIASMRQLGVGLTTAVLIDATIVRLVLLPALIRLAGRAAWWLPAWLDRLLPKFDLDADGAAAASTAPLNGGGDGRAVLAFPLGGVKRFVRTSEQLVPVGGVGGPGRESDAHT